MNNLYAQNMQKVIDRLEQDNANLRAALAAHPVADAAAWMRKTDITEWADTEPETDGWTPLYRAAPSARALSTEQRESLSEAMLAMQIAAEKFEWIAAGEAPGKDYDLDGEKITATIRHAKQMAAYALSRLQPSRSVLAKLYRSSIAATSAPAPVATGEPTDLSKRLREHDDPRLYHEADVLMSQAADEIERYYGGMLAWKQTAEKKDADWNAERMARVKERCAARPVADAGEAVVVSTTIGAPLYKVGDKYVPVSCARLDKGTCGCTAYCGEYWRRNPTGHAAQASPAGATEAAPDLGVRDALADKFQQFLDIETGVTSGVLPRFANLGNTVFATANKSAFHLDLDDLRDAIRALRSQPATEAPSERDAAIQDLQYVAGFRAGRIAEDAQDEAAFAAVDRRSEEAMRALRRSAASQEGGEA